MSWDLHIAHDGTLEIYNNISVSNAYVVTDDLTADHKSGWGQRLEDVGFFCLADNYSPAETVADGFSHSMTVNNRGRTHTVYVESGSNAPAELTELLWDIFNEIILAVYYDSTTIGTLVSKKSPLLEWPFAEQAPLLAAAYAFADVDSTGEIRTFLDSLYYPGGWRQNSTEYFFLNNSMVHTIGYWGGDEFGFRSGDSLYHWPKNIPITLGDIGDDGLVLKGDLYRQVRSIIGTPPNHRYYFYEGEIKLASILHYIQIRPGVATSRTQAAN